MVASAPLEDGQKPIQTRRENERLREENQNFLAPVVAARPTGSPEAAAQRIVDAITESDELSAEKYALQREQAKLRREFQFLSKEIMGDGLGLGCADFDPNQKACPEYDSALVERLAPLLVESQELREEKQNLKNQREQLLSAIGSDQGISNKEARATVLPAEVPSSHNLACTLGSAVSTPTKSPLSPALSAKSLGRSGRLLQSMLAPPEDCILPIEEIKVEEETPEEANELKRAAVSKILSKQVRASSPPSPKLPRSRTHHSQTLPPTENVGEEAVRTALQSLCNNYR